jgi:hypothetical protein
MLRCSRGAGRSKTCVDICPYMQWKQWHGLVVDGTEPLVNFLLYRSRPQTFGCQTILCDCYSVIFA